MFLTPHAATGLYLGSQVDNVWLAFILGIVSHLILDMIPHGDDGLADNWPRKTKIIRLSIFVAIDMALITAMTYYLTVHNFISLSPAVMAGLIGSILPDYIWGWHEISKDKISGWISSQILYRLHHFLPVKLPLIIGIFIQLAALAIFLALLIS